MKKLLVSLFVLFVISAFSFPFFVGLEAINVPPVSLSATPSVLTVNARLDLGMFYFSLPVAELFDDGTYNINNDFSTDFILSHLNVGISLKPKIPMIPLYARVGADLPVFDLLVNQTFSTFDLKVGVGFKFLLVALEGGVVARFEKQNDSMNMNFGSIFYFAAGAAF